MGIIAHGVVVTDAEALTEIHNSPDTINLGRFGGSLKKFMERYPDGAPNNTTIAKALCISENQVEEIYAEALELMKTFFTNNT